MVTIDVVTGRREDMESPVSSMTDTQIQGTPSVGVTPPVTVRAETQRSDAAAILRLAAFRTLEGHPLSHVEVLLKRALAHIGAAERIEQGER